MARVLHVVTAFPRSTDDVMIVPWLVELLKRLRARGHDVAVFTSSYRGLDDQTLWDIPVYRFRYWFRRWERLTHEETALDRMRRSVLYRFLPLPFLALGLLAIRRHCRRERYDVIHVHWPVPLALWGHVAARACGAPLVLTFYSAELRWAQRGRGLLARFTVWAARRADRVVAISGDTAQTVLAATGVSPDVIPYGVGISAEGRQRSGGHPEDPFGLLFVGRLVERKGVTHLIDALSHLRDLSVSCVVVGDGPERAALEQQAARLGIAERVRFVGRVSDDQLREHYEHAGAVVLPAVRDRHGDTEGLGVVLLEAMQLGVPVVGSRIGGITDIVEDGESGLLVPPGDAAALAAAIRRLVTDRALAERVGAAGRARAEERFGWDAVTGRWEQLYGEVTTQPRTVSRPR